MDEHACKRLKDDEINNDIGEEEQEQKMKGGRGGKKAKGVKKRKNLRSVPPPLYLRYFSNQLFYTGRKTSLDKAREDAVEKEVSKAYK